MPSMKKSKIADSEALRSSSMQKRKYEVVAIKNMPPGRFVVLQDKDLNELRVDERYQRLRITDVVNTLIHVLLLGGDIPDPVSIAERPDGTRWIVDGQQRYWAHVEAKKPLKAMIYKVADYETEQRLFLVLNAQRKVSANYIIHSWAGPIGAILRGLDTPDQVYFGKIDWGSTSNRPFSAGILLRGVAMTLGVAIRGGSTIALLSRVDRALAEPGARKKAETYLEMIAALYYDAHGTYRRLRLLAALAYGIIAHTRWTNGSLAMPFESDFKRLRQMNWDTVVPSHAAKFLPVVVAEVEKRWTGS